jgi:hypothetical protein
MADHRFCFPRLEPSFEAAGSACRPMPIAIWAHDALTKAGGAGLVRSAPGDPLTSPGRDLSSKIRVPGPPPPLPGWRATRRAGCWERVVRAGMGGRGLSHPQELPLISAGSRRALARTGACGQPGSRTANRMAVPLSPSIRERACPARPWPARTAAGYGRGGASWTHSAGSTGRKTCDTRLHVASECADWRADDVGGVAPGQCSGPVPALTCVAGNCGVRSSGKKPKRVPFHPGAQARGRPDGRT